MWTNTFSFTVNSVTATTNNNQFYIKYDSPAETSSNGFGDNLLTEPLKMAGQSSLSQTSMQRLRTSGSI
jgi:hypothetical protein